MCRRDWNRLVSPFCATLHLNSSFQLANQDLLKTFSPQPGSTRPASLNRFHKINRLLSNGPSG
jgi:hypothetical protein